MRILIVSDTHKNSRNFFYVTRKEKGMDCIVHCGDVCGEEELLEETAPCRLEMVAGNMDFNSYLPMQKEIRLGNVKAMIAHGHQYSVNETLAELYHVANQKEAKIFFFGHTHRPCVVERDGVWMVNPGSLALPRQENGRASYAVMEISNQGEISCEIRYV